MRTLTLVSLLGICVYGMALASWPDDTATNLAVCTAEGDQRFPVLVADGSGGSIFFWQDTRAGSRDVYAQRLNAEGHALWEADGMAVCSEDGAQGWPDAVSDGQGGAIVVWGDGRHRSQDIYAQRIDSNGQKLWAPEGVPVCTDPTLQEDIALVPDGDGGIIAAWEDWRNGNQDVYAQRISADGQPLWGKNGLAIVQTPGDQYDPTLSVDAQGGIIAVWWDIAIPDWDIYAQRLDPVGNPLWGETGVLVCAAPGNQGGPLAIPDGAGGAIVVWVDYRVDPLGDLYAQYLAADGALQWLENGLPICTLTNAQQQPTAISDGQGGVIITWWDERDLYSDIYAQRISTSGEVKWQTDGQPVCLAEGVQREPQIMSAGETACILWKDFREDYGDVLVDHVYAQQLDLSGNALWETDGLAITTAKGEQNQPKGLWLPSGFIVTWSDQRNGQEADIYAHRIGVR